MLGAQPVPVTKAPAEVTGPRLHGDLHVSVTVGVAGERELSGRAHGLRRSVPAHPHTRGAVGEGVRRSRPPPARRCTREEAVGPPADLAGAVVAGSPGTPGSGGAKRVHRRRGFAGCAHQPACDGRPVGRDGVVIDTRLGHVGGGPGRRWRPNRRGRHQPKPTPIASTAESTAARTPTMSSRSGIQVHHGRRGGGSSVQPVVKAGLRAIPAAQGRATIASCSSDATTRPSTITCTSSTARSPCDSKRRTTIACTSATAPPPRARGAARRFGCGSSFLAPPRRARRGWPTRATPPGGRCRGPCTARSRRRRGRRSRCPIRHPVGRTSQEVSRPAARV